MADGIEQLHGVNAHRTGPLVAGPLIGEVGQAEARIWVQARDTAALSLRIFSAGAAEAEQELRLTPTVEDFLCLVFLVRDLRPGSQYEYSFVSEHGETPRGPLRLGVPAEATRIRIAFGSCYKDYDRAGLRIFDSIVAEAPDLFLMLGDTCYTDEADRRSEQAHMQAHLRNRNQDGLRRLVSAVPTLGIWDDHDFGPNDSDGTYAERARSLRCFCRMWAQRQYGTGEAAGIFSKVSAGPVELFLLDSRSYRRERQHILGEAQLSWLLSALGQSSAPVKLILSGSQLLPEVAAQRGWDWECFLRDGAAELAELQKFLAEQDIRGVIALSGDPHLGQLLHAPGLPRADGQRGPEQWELTSSPLANRPWHQPVWPADSHGEHAFDHHLWEEVAAENFGIVDVDLARKGSEVRLELCGQDGSRFFSYGIDLASLAVRPPRRRLCAAVRDDKRAYCFTNGEYARYDLNGSVEDGYPRPIADGWKGVFRDPLAEGQALDAVLFTNKGKAYFFLGNGYVRYDLAQDQVEPGYPKYIMRHWRGVWPAHLDAVLPADGDKVYFIKGPDCILYDLKEDRPDSGYPRRLGDEFPGVWPEGVDAAVAWADGAYYFIRGDEVLRYDPSLKQPAPGYPHPLSNEWFGFLK